MSTQEFTTTTTTVTTSTTGALFSEENIIDENFEILDDVDIVLTPMLKSENVNFIQSMGSNVVLKIPITDFQPDMANIGSDVFVENAQLMQKILTNELKNLE